MPEEPPEGADSPLADFRRAAGLTQEELAERSGLSTRGISSIECGRVARPHRRSLESLAAALGLDGGERDLLITHYRRYRAASPSVVGPATAPTGPP
ncbi:MAG: helix-turn-helix transcriptional regulator, partial [Actinocatenispora sp.]